MAVNRMRSAFAAPKKGETFELRAGLVYVYACQLLSQSLTSLDPNMPTKGSTPFLLDASPA
jgi:hypothetical protein